MNRLVKNCVLLSFAWLSACATDGPTYPVLKKTTTMDVDMSCQFLNGEFYSASSLRSEIIAAHGDAINKAVKDSVIGAVMNPADAVFSGVMKSVSVTGKAKQYAKASAAAGDRMEQVLRYKREKDCPEVPSRDPSLTDDNILTLLDEVLSRYEAGEIDEKEYFRQRSNLLNKMRDLKY